MSLVPNSDFKFLFFLGGLAGLFLLAWWGYNAIEKRKAEEAVRGAFTQFEVYDIPKTVPDIRIASPKGNEIRLKDFRGHYVVMNVWATWCRPCIEELPDLQRLQNRMRKRGVQVIAVSADFPKDLEKVEAFLQKNNIGDFARYHDTHGELQEKLGIRALPMTYILNKRGHIIYKIGGKAEWNSGRVMTFLEKVSR